LSSKLAILKNSTQKLKMTTLPQLMTGNYNSKNDDKPNVQLDLNKKHVKQLIENRTLFFNLIAETTFVNDCTSGNEQTTNLFTKYENEIRTNVNMSL
jgi:hypothetical protein